jgi:flagellin
MAVVVRTNVSANNAITNLNKTSRALARNFEKISTGLRIARSADDAAGQGVADKLRSLHRSADQAGRNINDGISIIGVADGAASEVSSILTRLRELAVQSSSETLANSERSYIQDEKTQLVSEIDRISQVTEFDGTKLADGANTQIDVQAGVRNTSNDRITLLLGDLTATTGLAVNTIDLSTASNAQTAIDTIDTAINSVNSVRSLYGAVENRLGNALNNIETFSEANKTAESRIRDADFGIETAALTQNQILQQAGVSILAQAKSLNQGALSLLQ